MKPSKAHPYYFGSYFLLLAIFISWIIEKGKDHLVIKESPRTDKKVFSDPQHLVIIFDVGHSNTETLFPSNISQNPQESLVDSFPYLT